MCPAGTFSSKPASSACEPCSAGEFSASGAPSCTTCPPGAYSGTKAPRCTLCGAGTASGDSGVTSSASCKTCPAGKYSPAGSPFCSTCRAGFYSSEKLAECTPCPAGSFSSAPGGDSSEACQKCPAGCDSLAGASSCVCKDVANYGPGWMIAFLVVVPSLSFLLCCFSRQDRSDACLLGTSRRARRDRSDASLLDVSRRELLVPAADDFEAGLVRPPATAPSYAGEGSGAAESGSN